MKKPITIETTIQASLPTVWESWTKPEHIVNWAFASQDWYAPVAENDLTVGGNFKTVMAARDGSAQFDFAGTYTNIKTNKLIEYSLGKERQVMVQFEEVEDAVKITQTFDPESQNPEEMQRQRWQAILDNFKKYVEVEKS